MIFRLNIWVVHLNFNYNLNLFHFNGLNALNLELHRKRGIKRHAEYLKQTFLPENEQGKSKKAEKKSWQMKAAHGTRYCWTFVPNELHSIDNVT